MSNAKPEETNEQRVITESVKHTYSAVISDFGPAANATDFIELIGVTGKLITLTQVIMSGSATSSTYQGMYLYKRSTLSSGGTEAPVAICRHDSSDPTPLASVNQYSANPSSLGAGVLIRSDHLGLPAAAAGTTQLVWEFANRGAKAPKLLNGQESFNLNFGGNAVPAGTNLHISFEWTEE